jgi:hypothetical protein
MAEFKGWVETGEGQYEADLGDLGKVYVGRTHGKWAASAFGWTRGELDSAGAAKLAAVRIVEEKLAVLIEKGAAARMTQEELAALRAKVERLDPRGR